MKLHSSIVFRKARIYLLFLFILASCYEQAKAQKVYVTRTGGKYHRGSCHYLKYSSFEIELADAQKRGYTPCSVCKPSAQTRQSSNGEQDNNQVAPVYKEKSTQSTSAQCSATTQAGSRCKRTTTNSNGRCWQHE